MDAFEILDLITEQQGRGERYMEFLRADMLSVGLYTLPVGDTDPQQPHTEDEIYYIVSGKAIIKVGDENRGIKQGSVIFVGAGVDHRFYDITEMLMVLVVFAPPRGSQGT